MRALAVALLLATAAGAQVPDSLRTRPAGPPVAAPASGTAPAAVDTARTRTPRGAVTRALVLPGLGQVYNRQPLKAPIAAALVVGAVAYAVNRQQQYTTFRRAAVFAGCRVDPGVDVDPDTGERTVTDPGRVELCTETAPGYEDEWVEVGRPEFALLTRQGGVRDQARGQRDVAVLLVGVAYGVQVLDAYVFAELATFDVSEDVAVDVAPRGGRAAMSLRVRL